jgi:hypothetical protein
VYVQHTMPLVKLCCVSMPTLCALALLCVATLCIVVSSAPIEIPCTTTANGSTVNVSSNNTYTLTDCVSDLLFIDLAPTQTPSSTVFENVTVRVVGGNVLPRLRVDGSYWVPLSIRNVHVMVDGAHVSHNVMITTDNEPALTLLDISGGTATVSGVSVTFVNASLRLVVGTSNGAPARVAPLMLLSAVGDSQRSATLQDVIVVVENSLISVNVSINGPSNFVSNNVVVMASVSVAHSGAIEQIQMSVVNCALVLVMVSEHPPNEYSAKDPTMILLRSVIDDGDVRLRGASLTSSGTSFTVLCRVPRQSKDFSSVIALGGGMLAVEDVVVDMQNISAVVESICGSNCRVADGAYPRSCVVGVVGVNSVTSMRNISVSVTFSTMIINTPKSAAFVAIQSNAVLIGASINVTSCVVQASSSGLSIAQASRTQSLVDISSSDNATNLQIVAERLAIMYFMESGDCALAVSSVINALDNISDASIHVADVVVTSRVINGTATILGGALAALTMGSNIVYLGIQTPSYVNTGVNISITVVNATLDVIHATTLPPGPLYMLVLSTTSIVNVVRLLTNCSIAVADSHVVRSPHPSAPLLAGVVPLLGAHFNVTSVVNLFDATQAALTINDQLTLFASLIYASSGGTPAAIVHSNVTTNITSNCTVSYHTIPDDTDCVSLVMMPSVSYGCTYVVEGTYAAPSQLPVGAVVAGLGQSRLVNSTITARHVHGLAMLLSASFKPMTFEGPLTSLVFDDVSVRRLDYSRDMMKYAIVTEATTIEALLDSTIWQPPRCPFLTISRCVFRGFAALLMPTSFTVTSALPGTAAGHAARVVIALGCNVWDGAGLPADRVTTNATLLRHIAYPRSSYNDSIGCRGSEGTRTTTASAQADLLTPETLPATQLSLPAASTTAAVYAALVTASLSGGGVGSLQRSMSGLRLASMCTEARAQSEDGDEAASMMSYDLSENPLRLRLPVGVDALRYAAGASVGNALLACAIGLALHVVAMAKKRCSADDRGGRLLASVVAALPSSLLVGALAVPYGTVGQPSIAACVALVISRRRTAQSVVCGAVMLCAWLAFPACCVYLVLVRGRRGSVFVLQSGRTTTAAASGAKGGGRDVDVLACVRRAHRLLMERRETWRMRPGRSGRSGEPREVRRYAAFLLERLEGVFGAYVGGREWYFAVEWCVLVLSGAVLGAAEASALDDAGSACTAARWGVGVSLALSAAQVVACVWLRPMSVRADFCVSVLLGTLSVVCQAMVLGGEVEAAARVASVASIAEVVLIVLLMVEGIVRTSAARRSSEVLALGGGTSFPRRIAQSRRMTPTCVRSGNADDVATRRAARCQSEQLETLVALISEGKRR